MKKAIKRILIFLSFALIAASLIYIGIYFEKRSNPIYIYKTGIDSITTKIDEYVKVDNKYILGDNINISGTVDVDLTSEKYSEEASTNIDSAKKNNMINNLSRMDIKYGFIQSKKDNKLLVSLDERINDEIIIDGKYLIDNSTKYYFVNNILKNYVNDGNNTYFELLNNEKTSLDNVDYLYGFIKDSLSKELGERAKKYVINTNVNNKQEELNEVSIRLTDKEIKNILKDILKSLKKDKEANKILSSIDNKFSKRKVNEKKEYLKKNESYTINIYSTKLFNKIKKYEIVYMNKDNTKNYSIDVNKNKGVFYYSEDNNLKYKASYIINSKKTNIDIYDNVDKKIGNVVIEKDVNNLLFTLTLKNKDKSYDIIASSKFKNYNKNQSYTNEITMSVKIMEKQKSVLSGTIKSISKVNNKPIITEDTAEAVLKSTLTDEENDKIDNLYDNIKGRLENA